MDKELLRNVEDIKSTFREVAFNGLKVESSQDDVIVEAFNKVKEEYCEGEFAEYEEGELLDIILDFKIIEGTREWLSGTPEKDMITFERAEE